MATDFWVQTDAKTKQRPKELVGLGWKTGTGQLTVKRHMASTDGDSDVDAQVAVIGEELGHVVIEHQTVAVHDG